MITSKNLDPDAGRWYTFRLAAQDAVQGFINPTNKPVMISRAVLHIITGGGANTADIGVATSVATNDTLLDGVSIATAGVFDNIVNKGSNGKEIKLLAAGSYITVDCSAAPTGLVADLHVYLKKMNAA